MGCLKWKVDPSQKCPNYAPYTYGITKHVTKTYPCEYRKRQCLGDNFCVHEPTSVSQKNTSEVEK